MIGNAPRCLGLLLLSFVTDFSYANKTLNYPAAKDWLAHTAIIAQYWMQPAAQGARMGHYPTFRCDDGSLPNPDALCQELLDIGAKDKLGRHYTRMQSRQLYTYLALFHLSGDQAAFTAAEAGLQVLLGMRQTNGGFALYVDSSGQISPEPVSAQDAAYALLGLAMYDYLTRDQRIHQILLSEIDSLFKNYYDPDSQAFTWWPRTTPKDRNQRRELVAQLDQLNAYLMLVIKISTPEEKSTLNRYRQKIVDALMNQYVDLEQCRVFGALHHKYFMLPDNGHNDFGHAAKTWWNLSLNQDLLSAEHTQKVNHCLTQTLTQATREMTLTELLPYVPEEKREKWQATEDLTTWKGYHYDNYVNSWQWAELDQGLIIASLLQEEAFPRQLSLTTWQFLDAWVDTKHGGIGLNPRTNKQFEWMNGYHHTEHALFGLLASEPIYHQPVSLYFAYRSDHPADFFPYLLAGQVKNITPFKLKARQGSKVAFSTINLSKGPAND